MPAHVFEPAVSQTILTTQAAARLSETRTVPVDGQPRTVRSPFPSPGDWRDNWIYFLMNDRLNNGANPATTTPDIGDLHEYC